ncbi:MAG: phage late control D family protein [Anaerotignum sp.]|nr:phage late control D family protein [Anaerotignum sp.]MBR4113185.1 phage late control D family protein [Anaerotignum sp.]
MATYTYANLKSKYDNFHHPVIVLKVNGKDFAKNKAGLVVSDIEVELTSGFEASIASFMIYNTFDTDNSCYRINDIKAYIMLGSSVEIALGYEKEAQIVFCGYISRVNFVYEEGDMPGVRVTAMDVKGAMMANNYSRQLTATTYGEAVREILNKGPYMSMSGSQIIKQVVVSDTPDKPLVPPVPPKASDRTVEMVAESDYEFCVKAAKKYNYEFFTECGNVYFRPAKSNTEIVMAMGPAEGLRFFDIEYDITGLVETVKARSTDVGKAKLIEAQQKMNNKISIGNKAKKFVKKSEKVYLDATITSKEEAENRVNSLVEEISYRFGTLECVCIGLPELLPGKFFELKSMGSPPENKFYLHRVVHRMNQDEGFTTKLYGKAASIENSTLGGLTGGLI